jgi:hypothetical protein
MANSRTTRWNPNCLAGCVRHALELLPNKGLAIALFMEAAGHLKSIDTYECRDYRAMLKKRVERFRRLRRMEPWEYWLLSAARQLLQPIPGTKNSAVTILGSAIDEYQQGLGETFWEWHEQHAIKEPAYL